MSFLVLLDKSGTPKRALKAFQRNMPDFRISRTLIALPDSYPFGNASDYPLVLAFDATNRALANFRFIAKKKAEVKIFRMEELSSLMVKEEVQNLGRQVVDGPFNPEKAVSGALLFGAPGLFFGRDFQRIDNAKGIRYIKLHLTEKTDGTSHRLYLFQAWVSWAFQKGIVRRAIVADKLKRAVEFSEELEHAWGSPCLDISFAKDFSLPKYDYNLPSSD